MVVGACRKYCQILICISGGSFEKRGKRGKRGDRGSSCLVRRMILLKKDFSSRRLLSCLGVIMAGESGCESVLNNSSRGIRMTEMVMMAGLKRNILFLSSSVVEISLGFMGRSNQHNNSSLAILAWVGVIRMKRGEACCNPRISTDQRGRKDFVRIRVIF